MATNNINELYDDDSMSVDTTELSTTDVEGQQQQQSKKFDFAGPYNAFVCIHFIILCHISNISGDRTALDLDSELLEVFSRNNLNVNDDDKKILEDVAKMYNLNVYICILNGNEGKFYYLNTATEQNGQPCSCAYIVFDKKNRIFYPFFNYDSNNNKYSTTFPMDDTYYLRVFEDLVADTWPSYFQPTYQFDEKNDTEEDTLAIDVDPSILDISDTSKSNNLSEEILKSSDLCNLLVQNIQKLLPLVGPQLNILKLTFKSSEYQVNIADITTPKAAAEALQLQLQLLSKLSELGVASSQNNSRTTSSIDITERTALIRDQSLNNHEQVAPLGTQIRINPPRQLYLLSSTTTINDRLSITTNDFHRAIKLSKVVLLNQSTRLRKHRFLQELHGNGCPTVQIEGAGQGEFLKFKLPDEINIYPHEFYLGAHATTYDKKEHEQRLVVPTNISIKDDFNLKTNDLSGLIVLKTKDNDDEFDINTRGAFTKINPIDMKNFYKEWTFKLVNLYQDRIITKTLITNKKLKWCRVMFAIYIKLPNEQFERVSPTTFSDLIKETNGAQSVNIATIYPDRFCKNGGQMIFIPVTGPVDKDGIRVCCNEKYIDKNKFQIAGNILSFESPACIPDNDDIHIVIDNLRTRRSSSFHRPYHSHDDHLDPCGEINED